MFQYEEIKVERAEFTKENGLAFLVKIRPFKKTIKNYDWKRSKRLMKGCFLVLVSNSGSQILFTVLQNIKTQTYFETGLVEATLEITNLKPKEYCDLQVLTSSRYTAYESKVFFEAYKFVLYRLKELDLQRLPFKDYLTCCSFDKTLPYPSYINKNTIYTIDLNLNPHTK
jgi:hypothetical protein